MKIIIINKFSLPTGKFKKNNKNKPSIYKVNKFFMRIILLNILPFYVIIRV